MGLVLSGRPLRQRVGMQQLHERCGPWRARILGAEHHNEFLSSALLHSLYAHDLSSDARCIAALIRRSTCCNCSK